MTGSALEGFPTTENAFQRVFVGPRDVFLTKFSSGGKLIYSSYLGGNEEEGSPVVALDRDTNAYLTGHIIFEIETPEVSFPVTPGALQSNFRRRPKRWIRSQSGGAVRAQHGESLSNDMFTWKRKQGGIAGADHCGHNRRDSREADPGLPGWQKDL